MIIPAGRPGPPRLMAGLFEPVSSNVTVSPPLNATRLVPSNQLAALVFQMSAVPSPRHVRFDGSVTDVTATPTVFVMPTPSLTVNTKLPSPPNHAVGTQCSVAPLTSDTAPLL